MNSSVSSRHRQGILAVAVILCLLLIDQASKLWVKTHFYLGEDVEVFSWFHIRFIQNNGMAFGWELGSKLFLTAFRVIMVIFLIWALCVYIRIGDKKPGFIAAVAAVTAGAMGNIIDCVFYGEIFTNPWPPQIAEFVSPGHGYGSWFQGMVVDMLYFPLFSFRWPEWLPGIGGSVFSFFDPVFNIADAAITVGMLVIIIFYSNMLTFQASKNQ